MKHITIIEDNENLRLAYHYVLAHEYTISAFDGKQTTDELEDAITRSDLVISDFDGVNFAEVKELCRVFGKPLLLVSGESDLKLLHNNTLQKPVGAKALKDAIEQLTNKG
jgi:DNA-binding NtrC family response regulator